MGYSVTMSANKLAKKGVLLHERIYDVHEVAEILGVGLRTVNTYVHRGLLESFKHGTLTFYTESALRRFMQDRRQVGENAGKTDSRFSENFCRTDIDI